MFDRIKLTQTSVTIHELWDKTCYLKVWPPSQNVGREYLKLFAAQILQDHEIVNELMKCYRECRTRQECLAISQFETDQQCFMEKLYKRATGKDISEILEEKL